MRHNGGKSYDLGCRCDVCRIAHNERVRRSRAQRLSTGQLNHGTRSAYDAGCRCIPCTAARRVAYVTERQHAGGNL